jgi:hypothetical protein
MAKYYLGDLAYASNDSDVLGGFETDRGIPQGLVIRDTLNRRAYALSGFGDFGDVTPPFPEWYVSGIAQSSAPLSPKNATIKLDKITTIQQAMDYAAGSWKVAQSSGNTKALQRYRFAYDLGVWAGSIGISKAQAAAFVAHMKAKIKSGDEARAEASGKVATTKVEKTAVTKKELPKMPETPSAAVGAPSIFQK